MSNIDLKNIDTLKLEFVIADSARNGLPKEVVFSTTSSGLQAR